MDEEVLIIREHNHAAQMGRQCVHYSGPHGGIAFPTDASVFKTSPCYAKISKRDKMS